MLVEELITAFRAVLRDYSEFNVDCLFVLAANALSVRSTNSGQYAELAREVRTDAKRLIEASAYSSLPRRIKDLFNSSEYASVSPIRIGRMLFYALPDDPNQAISSGELTADKISWSLRVTRLPPSSRSVANSSWNRSNSKLEKRTLKSYSPRETTNVDWIQQGIYSNDGIIHWSYYQDYRANKGRNQKYNMLDLLRTSPFGLRPHFLFCLTFWNFITSY